MLKYRIANTFNIPASRVQDLIITAFEGGSNYWLGQGRVELVHPAYSDLPNDNVVWYGNSKRNVFAEPFIITIDVPGDKEYRLVNDSVRRAFRLMARNYPRHFADFLEENEDAITADIFLQLCLFGEVIYG